MQLLNISVQNRPSKSITSRPYPTDVMESISFSCAVDASQTNIPTIETQVYTVGLEHGTIRELLVSYKLNPEVSTYKAGVFDVQITYEVVYKKTSVEAESSAYHAGLLDVDITREVKHLTQTMDTERTIYSAGVFDVQITN